MHPTIEATQKANLKKVPEVKTGYTVEISQKVTEGNKERIQKFQGLVIKVGHGAGVEKTFTVRKIVEGIGVEKIFPLHSPNVTKIRVIKKASVRRQKLYYMRERFGKSARLSEKHVTDEERAAEEAKMEALYAEAIEAEKKRQAEEAKKEGDEVQIEKVETPVEEVAEKAPEEKTEKTEEKVEKTEEKVEEKTEETPEEPKEEKSEEEEKKE
jgi:large subunit ribosomal protein L19